MVECDDKELQEYRKSLYSCLFVNRTWFRVVIPILWKDFWGSRIQVYYTEKEKDAIISHLSDKAREKLRNQGIDLSIQQKPSYNYISFCRHLNLNFLERMIENEGKISSTISDEILKIFINNNTRFTHLYIFNQKFNYQIHLIPGSENCLSGLKSCHINYFTYATNQINQDILKGLAGISKKIEEFYIYYQVHENNNSGIIKLIDAQIAINKFCSEISSGRNNTFIKTIEKLLIKHANTLIYLRIDWKPVTKFLSCLVNLIRLEINASYVYYYINWSHLEGLSLPNLKILKINRVPPKILVSLVENTKGCLTEINICNGVDDRRLIQAIYQNCPKLRYLRLIINNNSILELENLLINCQNLNGLILLNDCNNDIHNFNWDNLFKILAKLSPDSLFRFEFLKYDFSNEILEPFRLFFDNWKNRHPMHPMSLKIFRERNFDRNELSKRFLDILEKYKAEGIIERYNDVNDTW